MIAIRIRIPHKKPRLNCCHIDSSLLLRLGYIISLSCIVSVIALNIKWLIYLDIFKGDNGQPWTPISLWNAIKWQSYMDFLIVINVFVRIFKTWQRRNNSHAFDHRYMPLLCYYFFTGKRHNVICLIVSFFLLYEVFFNSHFMLFPRKWKESMILYKHKHV